ncbi:hypothetical protein SSS_03683 [Sarcoptes scabiei]|uniref:Uncharacterized protein n=1 Tax=Sarcoptes scabiei TaxID=52283 RepID=A0A834VGC3_SARSC|nr:hypothetical protein SSS_03683 [Sarcoptes scabiei]
MLPSKSPKKLNPIVNAKIIDNYQSKETDRKYEEGNNATHRSLNVHLLRDRFEVKEQNRSRKLSPSIQRPFLKSLELKIRKSCKSPIYLHRCVQRKSAEKLKQNIAVDEKVAIIEGKKIDDSNLKEKFAVKNEKSEAEVSENVQEESYEIRISTSNNDDDNVEHHHFHHRIPSPNGTINTVEYKVVIEEDHIKTPHLDCKGCEQIMNTDLEATNLPITCESFIVYRGNNRVQLGCDHCHQLRLIQLNYKDYLIKRFGVGRFKLAETEAEHRIDDRRHRKNRKKRKSKRIGSEHYGPAIDHESLIDKECFDLTPEAHNSITSSSWTTDIPFVFVADAKNSFDSKSNDHEEMIIVCDKYLEDAVCQQNKIIAKQLKADQNQRKNLSLPMMNPRIESRKHPHLKVLKLPRPVCNNPNYWIEKNKN